MCILNHHAAHIYLCGDMRRTVYEQYLEFMWTEICSIIQEKYSKFMWIEIRSIIWKISIPMFSLCDKNQYKHKP